MTANPTPLLVDRAWLERRDTPVLLIDARPVAQYRRGHLPGAIHLDSFPYVNERTDAEGLARIVADWARCFGEAGITQADTVVFYDAGMQNRAPRGAFMLRYLGHAASHVLHGGVRAWREAGGELTKESAERRPLPGAAYPISLRPELIATADEVHAALDRPDTVLLDVRGVGENRGTSRLQWNPRMGRLPGAAYVEWTSLLENRDRFKSPEEMRAILAEAGLSPEQEVIVYCQRSHRATNTYLALEALGYPRVRVYIGSFFEWSRRPDLPIDRPARRAT